MASSLTPEPGKRVGIWIRVSTEDQALGECQAHHENRAPMYADSKDWTVIEVYHFEGVSGKAVSEHPEAKRMLADVATGHITALFSRGSRVWPATPESFWTSQNTSSGMQQTLSRFKRLSTLPPLPAASSTR